jgi:hypothetical protein
VKTFFYTFLLFASTLSFSKTIVVGSNAQYTSIQNASQIANAGDTIFVQPGVYQGGMTINMLRGNFDKMIHIVADKSGEVIIRGGGNSIQFVKLRYLCLDGLIIENQTANGMNIDNGGDNTTLSGNILIKNCTFRNINATGNNDLLKLSGLDSIEVTNCKFTNGAKGGSGVDMVGCHFAKFNSNEFKNMGSNAVQAKGGSQYIDISSNFFENCGERTLNIGGSTGLSFFRPIDVKFEASDIFIYSNIIIGSVAPICYVGSKKVDVINNTIVNPEKWVIRILQETVDTSRFVPCSEGRFMNNIVYQGNLSTETNIGPNTSPNTFLFNNNFWYNSANSNWSGPKLPSNDPNQRINFDPLFESLSNNNFKLQSTSKAKEYIDYTLNPIFDFFGNKYLNPRSSGAIETNSVSNTESESEFDISIYPNPARNIVRVNGIEGQIKVSNNVGSIILIEEIRNNSTLDLSKFENGIYYITHKNKSTKFIIYR